MRKRERIPLHDHSDLDSGGFVASSTVVTQLTTGGSTTIITGVSTAAEVSYENATSGLTATTVQAAIDELTLATAAPALDDLSDVTVPTPTDGDVLTWDSGTSKWVNAVPPGAAGGDVSGQFIAGWDGGGVTVAAGAKVDIVAPFSGTITGWTMLADQTGDAVVDIWLDSYANFPPTIADTITAAAKPTISAAAKATSTTLTGWTTAVTAGDVLRFNLDSAASITRLVLVLAYSRP